MTKCVRRCARQVAQGFPRRSVSPVDILLFAARIGDSLRLTAWPMEIQIGIEVTLVEAVDVFSVRRGDVTVAHVLADHRSIFGFHQAVVLLWRGRDLVCSINNRWSKPDTDSLMNSEPLSE